MLQRAPNSLSSKIVYLRILFYCTTVVFKHSQQEQYPFDFFLLQFVNLTGSLWLGHTIFNLER